VPLALAGAMLWAEEHPGWWRSRARAASA
jgi:hypothetical protein